jgi:hypothetical protein
MQRTSLQASTQSFNRSLPRAPVFTRWVIWLPAMMVGAMLYWTMALGLGGLSLMAASAFSMAPAVDDIAAISTDYGPSTLSAIPVHLEESAEPEDVNDTVGAGYSAPAEETIAPPGATSF